MPTSVNDLKHQPNPVPNGQRFATNIRSVGRPKNNISLQIPARSLPLRLLLSSYARARTTAARGMPEAMLAKGRSCNTSRARLHCALRRTRGTRHAETSSKRMPNAGSKLGDVAKCNGYKQEIAVD